MAEPKLLTEAEAREVSARLDQERVAAARLEKELQAFGGGLPYDRARIIDKTQESLKKGVMAHFEAGCGMILLHENDRQTFAGILEQYFPGISERTARNYRIFAKQAATLPNFKAFCEGGGGWSKGLTMLAACTEAELEEFETAGELRGYKPDEIARMSVRQLQKALRRAAEAQETAVAKATEALKREKLSLEDKIQDLEADLQTAGSPIDKAVALIKAADKKVLEGLGMLTKVDREVMVDSKIVRDLLFGLVGLAYRVLENLETEASTAIGEAEARRQADDE